MDLLWNRYNELYRTQRSIQRRRNDQCYMMLALAESTVRVHPLPRTYNARIDRPLSLHGPAIIGHGHPCDWEDIKSRINRDTGTRCWNPKKKALV